MISIPYNPDEDSSLINYRRMGQAKQDIILMGEALIRFPYSVECKAAESLNILQAIKQAQSNINTKEPTDWLVVHKRKTLEEPIVIFSWSAFKKLFLK